MSGIDGKHCAARGFVAVLAFAAACQSPDVAEPGRPIVSSDAIFPGLSQTIRVDPSEPATADTIRISSVLKNRSWQPVAIQARFCGLGLRTDLALRDAFLSCGAYSMSGTLGPGESMTETAMRIVDSGPGSYSLRVRHLLNPEHWVRLEIRVRR
jgi:hypothetical protein